MEERMKHGIRPTKKQKIFLKKFKLNPENWLIVKDCGQCFEIVNRRILTGRKTK